MIIELKDISFTNDFFTTPLPDGSSLVINKIDEDFFADEDEITLDTFNIEVITENTNVLCSSVIGTGNEFFKLMSDHTEYLGLLLDSKNIQYCYLEIADE